MENPFLLLAALLFAGVAGADEVQVAVAANFATPMKEIAADFEKATGHKAVLAFGSTGKFYAQIKNNAPFDVFLAADSKTPAKLVGEGAADAASQFTYAKGKLVLWSAKPAIVDGQGEVFRQHSVLNVTVTWDGRVAASMATEIGPTAAISRASLPARPLTMSAPGRARCRSGRRAPARSARRRQER